MTPKKRIIRKPGTEDPYVLYIILHMILGFPLSSLCFGILASYFYMSDALGWMFFAALLLIYVVVPVSLLVGWLFAREVMKMQLVRDLRGCCITVSLGMVSYATPFILLLLLTYDKDFWLLLLLTLLGGAVPPLLSLWALPRTLPISDNNDTA